MNMLRGLVSKQKVRFYQDGFDLDLSYISDKIIAMGFPAKGTEKYFRNPLDQVQKFFMKYHPNAFKIYNLCSEREYNSDVFECVGGWVEDRIAFDDHNAPPFSFILEFCLDLDDWLSASYQNVAAIHCKAGKGRTGTMIACYLLWSGVCKSSTEALEVFGTLRTHNGKGVTIPSQIRYVQYFEKCLASQGTESIRQVISFPKSSASIHIDKIVLQTIPHFDPDGGCDPYVIIEATNGKSVIETPTKSPIQYDVTYDYRKHVSKLEHFNPKKHDMITMNIDLDVSGDVKFFFWDEDTFADDKMFQFWINTDFLDPKSKVLRFRKVDLDRAIKDKANKYFDATFTVEIFYSFNSQAEFSNVQTPHRNQSNVGLFGWNAEVNTV